MKPFTPTKISLISFHQMQQGIFNYIHFAFRGDTAKQAVMREAWRKAIAHLAQVFKTSASSKWYWGKLHPDHAKHAPFRAHPILSKFFDLTFPGVGNMHTPNMGRMEVQ
jgi:acyl-homoserine lactone acylase PvdQ